MICTFLRAVRCTEKLHRSSGKRLFLAHFVLNKACLKTEPNWRWGPQEQKRTVRPRCILGVTQKTVWTQGQSLQRAKEDGSKQVSAHRSQSGETAISTSQKGGLFYTIFRELFSSSSPNKIYGKALEKCRLHPEVLSVFGEPVKGYGEMTRRGRRQHVSFIEYVKDGLKHMRVKFYIQGSEPGKQGTVHLEVKENPESGEYEFQYIFVELEPYSRRTIVIEDNRS
ncbi:mitochondrial import inner membrane translocase subunit Tim21 isoform X2 [Eschrichtius robustus]|uniref:mitochondrial import inner membrane translocase subunit Tim21 isoform X2 n=1 Tax=Eschrichtius robustus TaxID=9764 RepID=UPI0035C0BFC9